LKNNYDSANPICIKSEFVNEKLIFDNGLREEIEQDEQSSNKQNTWMSLLMGILLLLVGLVLQFGKNLHDSVTHSVQDILQKHIMGACLQNQQQLSC
jgi:hypothetical protein